MGREIEGERILQGLGTSGLSIHPDGQADISGTTPPPPVSCVLLLVL